MMKIARLIFEINWMIEACEKLKFYIFMLFFAFYVKHTKYRKKIAAALPLLGHSVHPTRLAQAREPACAEAGREQACV